MKKIGVLVVSILIVAIMCISCGPTGVQVYLFDNNVEISNGVSLNVSNDFVNNRLVVSYSFSPSAKKHECTFNFNCSISSSGNVVFSYNSNAPQNSTLSITTDSGIPVQFDKDGNVTIINNTTLYISYENVSDSVKDIFKSLSSTTAQYEIRVSDKTFVAK